MKNLVIALLVVMPCATALFAQTNIETKSKEPVSLAELSKQPVCGSRHIAELTAEIEAAPQNPEYYLRRAYCYKITKNPDFINEVLTIVNLRPAISPRDFDSLNYLVLDKDRAKMEAVLIELAAAIPDHWYLYSIRAIHRTNTADYRGAIDDWVKTTELMPPPILARLGGPFYSLANLAIAEKNHGFFELTFSVLQKRQIELIAKLTDFQPASREYQEARKNIDDLGYQLQSFCLRWANIAVRLRNPKMESAALEKMVTVEPRLPGYQMRSRHYRSIGEIKKAFADELRVVELQIESNRSEFKRTASRDRQAALNNNVGELYVRLGDLYMRNEQFVKAIDNYEKAKSFSSPSSLFDWKINAALKRLNVSAQ